MPSSLKKEEDEMPRGRHHLVQFWSGLVQQELSAECVLTVVASHASLLKNKITAQLQLLAACAWLHISPHTGHGGALCPCPPKGSRHGDPHSHGHSHSPLLSIASPSPAGQHCRWSLIIC